MDVDAPPRPSTRILDVDGGVIEDARARQRRHRRLGVTALAVLALGLGLFFGDDGDNNGRRGAGSPHSGSALVAKPPATQTIRSQFSSEICTPKGAKPNADEPAPGTCEKL